MDIVSGLRRTASNFPDSPAIVDGNVRLNWRQTDERIRNLAAGLEGLGLQKGDRAAVLMLNGFRYLELYYGLPRMGGIIVPINTRLSQPEIIYTLNNSGASALIVDKTFAPLVKKIALELKYNPSIIFADSGEAPENMFSYEDLLEKGKERFFLDEQAEDDDLVGLFYTGGTTGNSKGVMLSHNNLHNNALHVLVHIQYKPGNVYLHVGPMFHLADGASTFGITMVGGCHTFLPSFDPVKVLQIVQEERVSHTMLVPTMINAVVQVPNIGEFDLSSWQLILYGASSIPTSVLRKAMGILPCKFTQAYGMTEASPVLTFFSPEDHIKGIEADPGTPEARRLTSAGQPCVGVDVRIVNGHDEVVSPGEIGEVVARGSIIMKGYWKMAEETAYGLRDGWLHTGDLATRDEHNFYFIVDRKKDMIITGGENVYSVEVENSIYSHSAVLEAAVVGVPDDKWGERVHAVIVLKPGQKASPEEIIEKCREQIGGFKLPRSIEFVDALPKSGAGKILKRTLRDKYWQGQERWVH